MSKPNVKSLQKAWKAFREKNTIAKKEEFISEVKKFAAGCTPRDQEADDLGIHLSKTGYLDTVADVLAHSTQVDEAALYSLLFPTWNLVCYSDVYAAAVVASPVFPRCLHLLPEVKVTRTLECVINIVESVSARPHLLTAQLRREVNRCTAHLRHHHDDVIRLVAAQVLSHTAYDRDLEELVDSGVVRMLMEMTSEASRATDHKVDRGRSEFYLTNLLQLTLDLSSNDKVKDTIIELNGVPICTTVLAGGTEAEQLKALDLLYTIASCDAGCDVIVSDPDCLKVLHTRCPADKGAQITMNNILYLVKRHTERREAGKADTPACVTSEGSRAASHVMISYNWGHKEIARRIAADLKRLGYTVWIDVDKMHGSTTERMAEAVEQARLVLICMSEAYKKSTNCKLEGDYVLQRKVKYIPLMMQSDYKPDGWLGMLLGVKLYVPFHNENSAKYKESLDNLVQQIKLFIDEDTAPDEPQTECKETSKQDEAKVTGSTSDTPDAAESVGQWSEDDFNNWLTKINQTKLRDKIDSLDRQLLIGLLLVREEGVTKLEEALKELDLNLVERLRMKGAMNKLRL